MFFSLWFWFYFLLLTVGMVVISLWAKKYNRGVADFMSANRTAGKYLITVATGMTGGSGMVAVWEMYYQSGATADWWNNIATPVGLVVAVTGFIIYRFRETRALTLFQFFEMRYSRKFRIFAGTLSFVSGLVNYGIFPLIVARLIITLLKFPETYTISIGSVSWDIAVLPAIMIFNLTIAAFIACVGGQIAIMLTDFYQEVICKILIVLMTCYLLCNFFWNDIFAGLATKRELVDPFGTGKLEDFNIWYFLIGVFGGIYNAKSWQGSSGYGTSAKTPHDAQMAGVLGRWRHLATQAAYVIPVLVAYAVMHNPKFESISKPIIDSGIDINNARDVLPAFFETCLPSWLFAGFAAMTFACSISIDDTSMHSWGGIFVQDVLAPSLKKPMSTKKHMWALRLSIIAVAIVAFVLSMIIDWAERTTGWQFPVFMFYAITGSIYLGGAGIVIIGGIYWNRGTTLAAWISMIAGSVLSLGGLVITYAWKPFFASRLHAAFGWEWIANNMDKFPINGQWLYFIAMAAATALFFIVSILIPQPPFNLDRMLHRGRYKIEGEMDNATSTELKKTWQEKIGYSKDFGKADGFLFWFTIGYCLFWWVNIVIGTVAYFICKANGTEIPIIVWDWYWHFFYACQVIVMIGATIWLTIGGICNALILPSDLKRHVATADDDGTVVKEQD